MLPPPLYNASFVFAKVLGYEKLYTALKKLKNFLKMLLLANCSTSTACCSTNYAVFLEFLWALLFSNFILFLRYLKQSFFDCNVTSFCHATKALLHISFSSLLTSSSFSLKQLRWTYVFGPMTVLLNLLPSA